MRQTIAFQATGFDCQPFEVEVADGEDPPDVETTPVAILAFQSGQNMLMTVPLAIGDAANLMNAFTEAEPHRESLPDAQSWQPSPSGLPDGLFWALTPNVVGVSVTPPQATPEGGVPHWTLAFDDEDGSQVQIAVSDAMCVQVVRALAGVANDAEDGADAPSE